MIEKKAELLLHILTILAMFIAGGWAINEYIEKQGEDRVKTALQYRFLFYQKDILDARRKLQTIWKETEVDRAVRDGNYDNYIINTITENNAAFDLELVVSFLDEIETCIAHDLCDEGVSVSLFGKEATALLKGYYPAIRVFGKNFEEGLIAFAGRRNNNVKHANIK